jgi:endonuclease/exonuclease/phosphatase family metal-dependent hydrolase
MIRIVSANLWNGRADPDAFAVLVEELRADVVAVQELGFAQAEGIAKVLPHGILEPADDFTGMGIAMRRAGQVWHLRLPCRDARLAEWEATTTGGAARVEILNVHVRAPHFLLTPRTYLHRRGQLRGLERHLDSAPNERRILVGDFNATPRWPFYRRVAERMSDAALVVARRRGARPLATWGRRPTTRRLLRIDHAFVQRLEVCDFRVVHVVGSDHSAIVVDVAPEGWDFGEGRG